MLEKESQTSEREFDVQASKSVLIETDSAPFELPFEGHISQAEKGKSESLKQTVNSGSAVKTVEEKDFLELKYIKQKITTELENAKLKLSTQELQISELKNIISQTVTSETECQIKIGLARRRD